MGENMCPAETELAAALEAWLFEATEVIPARFDELVERSVRQFD